jgi:hypothetical protein
MRSLNSSIERSILSKSVERLNVDLSNIKHNNNVTLLVKSPLTAKHYNRAVFNNPFNVNKKPKKAIDNNASGKNAAKKKTLNKAIYEALVINKTSLLKKTITEMNHNAQSDSKLLTPNVILLQ